jgi:hypothetical protein
MMVPLVWTLAKRAGGTRMHRCRGEASPESLPQVGATDQTGLRRLVPSGTPSPSANASEEPHYGGHRGSVRPVGQERGVLERVVFGHDGGVGRRVPAAAGPGGRC